MKPWWISLIIVALAGINGCARETASNAPKEAEPAKPVAEGKQSVGTAAQSETLALKPQPSQTPFVGAAQSSSSLAVPNLIPPTSSAVRVPQSEVGRPDPFATILVPPTVTFKPAPPSAASSAPVPAAPATVPAALPSLPTVQAAPITQFPPVSVPNLPPPRPLSETVEISGIVEVGGKTSVIVKAPDEHTSRYVNVGDYLGNGKVLVKRVEMGIDPVVILEENGAEVTRSVGGGSSLAGLL